MNSMSRGLLQSPTNPIEFWGKTISQRCAHVKSHEKSNDRRRQGSRTGEEQREKPQDMNAKCVSKHGGCIREGTNRLDRP